MRVYPDFPVGVLSVDDREARAEGHRLLRCECVHAIVVSQAHKEHGGRGCGPFNRQVLGDTGTAFFEVGASP